MDEKPKKRGRQTVLVGVTLGTLACVVLAGPAVGAPRGNSGTRLADTRVSVGSPHVPYARNSQNEPSVAVDPAHPDVLIAGANDLIDEWDDSDPATQADVVAPGVGISGAYVSLDGGRSWTQPTYAGLSARSGTVATGPIGTLPWYAEANLQSAGDPSVAFGPRPGPDRRFSWANGSRAYYANLAFSIGSDRKDDAVKGVLGVAVSRSDDLRAAAQGGRAGQGAWMPPVIVSAERGQTAGNDKEQIWADTAASSPHFGNAYACWVSFRSDTAADASSGHPDPVMLSRSSDGGASWSAPKQLTAATNNNNQLRTKGRQGCSVRTDSRGTVYVVFAGGDASGHEALLLTRSFDGGASFETPRTVASVAGIVVGDFDGVAGWEKNAFPSIDVANNAPTGTAATDRVFLTWADSRAGLNHEEVLVEISRDRGTTFSAPISASEAGDRGNFAAIAVSPDGADLYLAYDAYLDPARANTTDVRRVQGVVRHAIVAGSGAIGPFTTTWRAPIGDVRAIMFRYQERWGDYNTVTATNGFAFATWNDVRNATVCPGVNAYRQALLTDPSSAVAPVIGRDCAGFGDSDIYGLRVPDPTP